MRTRTNYRSRTRKSSFSEPLWRFLQDKRRIVGLSLLFMAGIAAGTIAVRTLDENTVKNLLTVLTGFIEARQTQTLAQTLLSSLTQNIALMILLFFCGFCAIAAPIVYMVPLFKGMGYGLTAGAMLSFYGVKAVPFITFLILPNTLISALILIIACEEALRMSRHFLSVIKTVEIPRGEQLPTPGQYSAKFIFLCLAIVGGALIESYLFLFGMGIFGL